MINVDLVEGVDFYAGAFPAARGNALSSVMEFRFKDPRRDQWTANAVLGTSDVGLTLEGPTGENSSLIMSVRRSYLQLLFEVIGLPFLPIYAKQLGIDTVGVGVVFAALPIIGNLAKPIAGWISDRCVVSFKKRKL